MKVPPLDILPTDVVESISVTKAFTPDLYGDFSGGAVNIATKRATGENILKVSLGGGLNTRSTFQEQRSYNGGGSDFWGRDDGTRAVPPGVLSQGVAVGGESEPCFLDDALCGVLDNGGPDSCRCGDCLGDLGVLG
jgi:outer membrane receptor protein involved in Fe transport